MMVWLTHVVAALAGAAALYGYLYARMKMRELRERMTASKMRDFVESIFSQVEAQLEQEPPQCGNPNCPACSARRRAEEQRQRSVN